MGNHQSSGSERKVLPMFEEVRGAFTEEVALSWAFPTGKGRGIPNEGTCKQRARGRKGHDGWWNLDERAKRELA